MLVGCSLSDLLHVSVWVGWRKALKERASEHSETSPNVGYTVQCIGKCCGHWSSRQATGVGLVILRASCVRSLRGSAAAAAAKSLLMLDVDFKLQPLSS